ncbi:glycoside hydrolase family 43 protein [Microbacterium sp. 22215]|uniref:glycoside hydrolase family 43 protein n=1 Tax=Microbacterium sp. 22215 TaxID=3453893 RepID=UPI003F832E48
MNTNLDTTTTRGDVREPVRFAASREPIIAGFHPDPSICRAGDEYFLVNSSFEYSPGVPVWRSRDLERWSLIGNAFTPEQNWVPGHASPGGGIYAPTIRHHDGRFWIITTDVSASAGQVITSATDPAGPWSSLQRIEGLVGIDPDIAWDGDDCYVTYCSTDPDMPGIAQARVDLATGDILEGPHVLWRGTGLAFPEAPHLYQHDHWWYLVIAEGGTERGHGVSVARSRSPRGPFVSSSENPIFSHRSTSHAVQNTGHVDLVEKPDGEWAAVYLGVRPRGVTPMFHVNGRETFLAGVTWSDGWPVIEVDRYELDAPDRSFTDTLEAPLHPRWISPGLARESQLLPRDDGGVDVVEVAGPTRSLTAVVTRVTDEWWRFDAAVDDIRGEAAAVLRIDDDHWAEVRAESGKAVGILRIGPVEHRLGEPLLLDASAPVVLCVRTTDSRTGGPDDVVLGLVQAGVEYELGRFDGRYLSTEVAGGFTGRVVGVRAVSGAFRVRSVVYTARESASDERD